MTDHQYPIYEKSIENQIFMVMQSFGIYMNCMSQKTALKISLYSQNQVA
jgi:hypothetical protein